MSDEQAKFEALLAEIGTTYQIARTAAILGWDQRCYMPRGGAAYRGKQTAALARLVHERATAPALGEQIEALREWGATQPYDSFEASCMRAAARSYEQATRIPAELAARLSEVATAGYAAWLQAREAGDFGIFAPALEDVLAATIERADALGYNETRYDALLDHFEQDLTTAVVESLFARLKEGLVPLVRAAAERAQGDDAELRQRLASPADEQRIWPLLVGLLQQIGFDLDRGRLDQSEHPFTIGFNPNDVRLTTRLNPLQLCFFGTLHEGGHGLYEQGLPEALADTPVAGVASLGMHESQSRLWENVVGRSRAFWTYAFPRVREALPGLVEGCDATQMWRAVNHVEPSLIRTQADELTYNLHIFLRFDLEKRLVAGELAVRDLPEAWRAGMKELLGIVPPDDVQGVLQDVHWAQGQFGYFPTYTLGNVWSVQLYDRARRDDPQVADGFARGEFGALLGWMREHVHAVGGKFSGLELSERLTGRGPDPEPYLSYLETKYTEIYGL